MSDNSSQNNLIEEEVKKRKGIKWGKWAELTAGIFVMVFILFWFGKNLPGLPEPKSEDDRINFVFLGIGGNEQKPPDLTDTIIFASWKKETGEVNLLSLPRDIWLDSLKAKINTAYHYGNFSLVKKAVEEITGRSVNYFFLLDFNGFRQAVDYLGGIDINVERSFDDFKYPIAGKENDECGGDKEYLCRYEHLHFDSGWQKMDGERALKYVRSRNAVGDEGTDLARSARQQFFLKAFKDEVFSTRTLFNPKKILNLISIFSTFVKTDLNYNELFKLGWYGRKLKSSLINSEVLGAAGTESEKLIYHPAIHSSGQWVLIPKDKTWGEIHRHVDKRLSE